MKRKVHIRKLWILPIIAFLFSLFPQQVGKSQAGAAVVTAPALEAQAGVQNQVLGTISSSITSLQASQQVIQKTLEDVQWAKDLASLRRLYTLIENTVCTTRDLKMNLDLLGGLNNCFISFNYEAHLLKLNASADLLAAIISSGLLMTNGERISSLNDAIDKFEAAHRGLIRLNQSLKINLAARVFEQNMYSQAARLARYSRY